MAELNTFTAYKLSKFFEALMNIEISAFDPSVIILRKTGKR
jgi:hypothetical protein